MSYTIHTRPGGHATLEATEEWTGRDKLRFARAISRPAWCQLDVYDPSTDPSRGDYVEVRYNGSEVWTGTVRESEELQDNPGVWRISAADALSIVQRRSISTRREYTSTDEASVVRDILQRTGITSSSSPIRYTVNSILAGGTGNSVDEYRVEHQDPLKALQRIASIYGREFTIRRELISSTWYWVVYYEDELGTTGSSQATWTSGTEISNVRSVLDDWDKVNEVTVLGQGSGTSVPSGSSGTATTSDPRASLPFKAVQSSTVASSAASTLQSTFGSDRHVIVAEHEDLEPLTDGSLALGDLITVNDSNASSVGNLRIAAVEVDEIASNGWFSRATLVRSSIPILPQYTKEAGFRPAGIADITELSRDEMTFRQQSDNRTVGSLTVDGGGGATTTTAGVADGATVTASLSFSSRTFDTADDEELVFFWQAAASGGASDYEVEVRDPTTSTPIFQLHFEDVVSGRIMQDECRRLAATVAQFWGAGVHSSADLAVTNRTGAARDFSITLYGWVVPKHLHN